MASRLAFWILFCGLVVTAVSCRNGVPSSNEANNSAVSSTVDSHADEPKTRTSNLSADDFREIIRTYSADNGLRPLIENRDRDFLELRLWLNVGLVGDERLMVVRAGRNHGNAFYSEFEDWATSRPLPPQRNLSEPARGWKNLQDEVSNRLTAPGKLKPDPQFSPGRHEGLISLEYVLNGEYQFVVYGHHSSFGDAVRLKEVCGFLSAEFGLNLDCPGERTALGPIR